MSKSARKASSAQLHVSGPKGVVSGGLGPGRLVEVLLRCYGVTVEFDRGE